MSKNEKENIVDTCEEVIEQETIETEVNEEIKEPSECEKLREELETQKDSFLRLAAEYDNYRKRTQQEKLSIYAVCKGKKLLDGLCCGICVDG